MPKVTLLLMTYCQQDFVIDAVQACLQQEGEPLQIIISDDASSDETYYAMLESVKGYEGQHTLTVRQNSENMGMVAHLNLLMNLAVGEYIVIAAGDDVPHVDRVTKLVTLFDASPKAFAIYSNAILIDEIGKPLGMLYKNSELERCRSWEAMANQGTAKVTGCGLAWRREVFDVFGPLCADLKAEDQAIPFRAALLGDCVYMPEPLLQYRQLPGSLSFWRKYKKSFLKLSMQGMRSLHRNMLLKNYADVLAMEGDLKKINPKQSDLACFKLKQRVMTLGLESKVFSGTPVSWSQVLQLREVLVRLKLVLVILSPSLILLLKGLLLVVKKRK